MSYKTDYAQGKRFLTSLTPKIEKQIVQAYKDALDDTRIKIAEYYAKYPMTYQEMSKYKRLDKLETELIKIIRGFGSKVKRRATKGAERVYTTAHQIQGYALEKNFDVKFALPPQRAILEAINLPVTGLNLDDSLEASRKYLEQQIQSTVTRGLIRGDSYTDMVRDLKRTFEGNMNRHTMKVIRTQMHTVASIAQVDSVEYAESLGIEGRKYWMSSLDTRTRPDHREMDGKPADDDGYFTLPDGSRGEAPGLINEDNQNYGCRCTIEYRLDDVPPALRRDKGEVLEYKTYQQWFEDKYGEEP